MKDSTTVLFIDDDAEDRSFFCEAMGIVDPNIKRLTCDNGLEAIQLLSGAGAVVPDYIFMDINMPVMNGKECLALLKKMDGIKQIPVIMCSTSVYIDDRIECEQLGADFYLVKPDSLIKAISAFQHIFSLYETKQLNPLPANG